ncbi:uncharacterized protein LOC133792456 [Humulus lupulus]|uniref:uncharacterized protein LOC133792456 n=1 Tax=Humulus lupulus TaxID=3486 RepID=UPI002B40BED5|nr:uncharacterized protein LOC133792456 [Humulus lupulus]
MAHPCTRRTTPPTTTPTDDAPLPPPQSVGNGDHVQCDSKISIGAKNKFPFLDGSLPQSDTQNPLFYSQHPCNQMVMSWILHSIFQEIKSSIMFFDIATAMWSELNNRFDQGNGPRIFELRETLIALHQGDNSVTCYFANLKSIWDEMQKVKPRTPYTCDASMILPIDPFPSLSKVFSMIIQEECQRKLGSSHHSSFVAATTSVDSPNSQTKKMCPTRSHCQKQGHLKDKCYFLHGFPPGYGSRKTTNYNTTNTWKNLHNHPLLSSLNLFKLQALPMILQV